MKKSLLALAAMGAFAGAAQAQSSVTVYGILDVGLIGGSYRAANATIPKATGLEFGQGAESTTRLGFRGTEDLGGGARAFFTLEMALAMNGTNTLGSAANSNRQSFVGLGKKGLGELSIGTQYTSVFELASATSPGQLNNIVGDVIYGQQTNVATATSTANSLASQNANSGSDVGFTVRTANMLKLRSERMAGVQATGFYFMDNDNSTQTTTSTGYTGGKNNRNGWGAGLNYTLQNLYVGASYQSLKAVNPYTGTSAGIAAGCLTASQCTTGAVQIFGSSNNTGVNVQDNQFLGGATYNFGILTAYAQYVNRKVSSEINGNAYAKRQAQQIGVRGMLTKQIEGWGSIGNGRYSTFGTSNPTANFNGWQLGSNYLLSKRTNLYAIYGQVITSSTTGNNNSAGVSNYAVGVRHTF
jgi:predicted porin